MLAALVALLVGAASGSGATHTRHEQACTWGASSVTATVVNGKLQVSQPQTSGCIPPPSRPSK
jgi:hypothetical protein